MLRWTLHLKGEPNLLHNYYAAVAVGNRIWYFGGSCTIRGQVEVHVFNTVSLRWSKLPAVTVGGEQRPPEVPSIFWGHTAVLMDDVVYIWGGYPHCNVMYAFNVDDHCWFTPEVSGAVPEGRDDHSACLLGRVMYIYGGFNDSTGYSNDIYKLDTVAMVWSLVDASGTPASASDCHSATLIGAQMFVFGGQGTEDHPYSVTVFDTETDSWLSGTPSAQRLPEGRVGHPAFAFNGELYVFGGESFAQTFTDLWKFSPDTFSWSKVEPRGKGPSQNFWCCCCMLGDRVVIFDDDLYILDLSPSLKTLCKLAVIRYGVEQSELPHDIRWELAAMMKRPASPPRRGGGISNRRNQTR